jgi:hypothetical protein
MLYTAQTPINTQPKLGVSKIHASQGAADEKILLQLDAL